MELFPVKQYGSAFTKFMLYGDSGSGKTFASARSGSEKMKVAILVTEPNGLMSVRAANPDAMVVEASDIETIQKFIMAAADGTFKKKYDIEVVAFDSLTEMQMMIKESIAGKSTAMTQQQWGLLLDKTRRMLRSIRDIPMHVVCTALAKTDYTETGERYVVPALEGSIRREAAQYFNAVGYCYKTQEEQESKTGQTTKMVVHRVMLSGPSHYLCKGVHPLKATEEPNLNDWILRCMSNFGSAQQMGVAADPKRRKRR